MTEQTVIDYAFEFRSRVNRELHVRGWVDKDLAKALNVDSATIANAFKQFGSTNKPYQTRQQIRKLLNITDI
ncbi:hypothetical protein [Leuconostoc citreum]|uniref:hypothetical protein n=1 Tax=Leuconostoc citreum TaxID=33964 RepID=UPI001C1FAE33|nr:hypothetical protein [Leuconostoc citreum]MBU7450695.1 hypothetical protein [Leuconostoc citreum]